jgi:signal transduction histidine kinase
MAVHCLRIFRRSFLGETRTRLLLCYAAMMSGMIALSIPISNHMIVQLVNDREQSNIEEVIRGFREFISPGLTSVGQLTSEEIEVLLKQFLRSKSPEDDVYLISIVGSEFKASSPIALPVQIRPGSALMRHWAGLAKESRGSVKTSDPDIGSIIYYARPITSAGKVVAVFVAVQTTAGELQEARDVTNRLTGLFMGFLLISLFLTWLLSRVVLAPLRSLAATTRSIGEANLDERLPVNGKGELAEISRSFNGMMDRLQALITSQKELIQNAGHELRTPITIIRGNIELLHEDDEEAREEIVRLVLDEVDRMSRIIDDLALLARSDRPDFLKIKPMRVAQFTQDVFRKASSLAPRLWGLSEVADVTIEADEQRLSQCLINLALNASQHTAPSDRIDIGSRVERGVGVRFWVADSGEGMDAALLKRVFERFARGPQRGDKSHGSGLGLSIVKAIVNAHHGKVEMDSSLGLGSCITLVIPASQAAVMSGFPR